jgi:tartrate dehydrogenase/decarboxylase/D-malate dehydrogenase
VRAVGGLEVNVRLLKAVEHVTADPSLHTPDLGGKATTKQVTDAVCEALWQAND